MTIYRGVRRYHSITPTGHAQPLSKFRPSVPAGHVPDRDGYGLLLAEQDHQTLSARDASVEQVTLEHGIVLRQDGNDDNRIFGPLRFVDRGCIGENHLVKFAELEREREAVEINALISPVSRSIASTKPTSPL